MKILLLAGDHPRHKYLASMLQEYCYPEHSLQVFTQYRGTMLPEIPPGKHTWKDGRNWIKHFTERRECEHEYFERLCAPPGIKCDDINSPHVYQLITESPPPDLAIVFGTGMIREPLLSALPTDTYNIHLGLSPRYRGAATLFWPFYFLEPQFAGVTIHRITSEPDAGDILHQCRPELERFDGIHDVACKAVLTTTDDLLTLLKTFPSWELKRQKATGKNFLASDFKPQHLRMIYDVFQDNIVDEYLDGNLGDNQPILYQKNLEA